eukprot:GHVT01045126.1.p1 GENE.GHVT01045126.1~~GHVT01045126.1.p1  ORF type:complete len:460 (+),score=84.29 GHVT01045126.1:314-1693(+)
MRWRAAASAPVLIALLVLGVAPTRRRCSRNHEGLLEAARSAPEVALEAVVLPFLSLATAQVLGRCGGGLDGHVGRLRRAGTPGRLAPSFARLSLSWRSAKQSRTETGQSGGNRGAASPSFWTRPQFGQPAGPTTAWLASAVGASATVSRAARAMGSVNLTLGGGLRPATHPGLGFPAKAAAAQSAGAEVRAWVSVVGGGPLAQVVRRISSSEDAMAAFGGTAKGESAPPPGERAHVGRAVVIWCFDVDDEFLPIARELRQIKRARAVTSTEPRLSEKGGAGGSIGAEGRRASDVSRPAPDSLLFLRSLQRGAVAGPPLDVHVLLASPLGAGETAACLPGPSRDVLVDRLSVVTEVEQNVEKSGCPYTLVRYCPLQAATDSTAVSGGPEDISPAVRALKRNGASTIAAELDDTVLTRGTQGTTQTGKHFGAGPSPFCAQPKFCSTAEVPQPPPASCFVRQ